MRKALYLFLFILVTPIFINAQTIKGIVEDAQSHKTLSNATVQLLHNNMGKATDANGGFFLSAENIYEDTLLVSYTGYYTQIIPLSTEKENYTILLKPNEAGLNDVIINSVKKTVITTLNKFAFARQQPFSFERQVAQYFEAPRINTHLLEIKIAHSYQLYYGPYGINPITYPVKFRLHIYTEDTLTGLPGKDLVKNGIEIIDKGRQNIVIDLSSYNLQLPQKGFYIGIEKEIISFNTYHTMKYYRKEYFIKDIKTEPDIDLMPIRNNMVSKVWIKNKLNAWQKAELGTNVLAISAKIKY